MRFVHTSDWQIGMKASGLGATGAKVREQRFETGKRVVEAANRFGAEFLLVAGDLFEHNAVSRVLVHRVADILGGHNGPVFIIPGNHDPFVPGSVWEHPVWSEKSNLKILVRREVVEVPGGWLYPCPLYEKNSGADPTAWIRAADRTAINIGIAHGTVEGVHQEEPDYPIPRDAASRSGLDYLALGHWHSVTRYPDPAGHCRMAYAGTHETTKFGERESGRILKITIGHAGAPPEVETESVGAMTWLTLEKQLSAPGDFNALRRELDALANPDRTLLDIRLGGLLAAADRPELMRLYEIAQAGRFLHVQVDDGQLLPAPDDDGWLADLPPGVVRDVAEELHRLTQPGYTGPRPEGATPQLAGRALLELYAVLREVRP